jgi:hypothetical protein
MNNLFHHPGNRLDRDDAPVADTGEANASLHTQDGKEYILAELDDFDREVALVRMNSELMDLLEARSRPEKTYSLEEARELLDREP